LTNQLLDLGIKPQQIIHPYGITTQVFGWGSRSVGSIYGTFFDHGIDALTKEGKDFISRFDAANGRPPSYVENYCYVTPYIFKEAIEKAGTADDREKLRNALSALKTKEHTTGVPIEFDKNGARKEYMYFMEIQSVNGKRTYQSKQRYYIEWDPEVIPVYDLVK
jgi:ABC-type branched-subunit amino acid transport system substrate-binding protein